MKPHFFILGNPRSGTTLFRLMLNSHPSLVVPPECGFAEWHYERFKNWSSKDAVDESSVSHFLRALSDSKKIETWDLNFVDLGNRIRQESPNSYAELCELVYLQFGEKIKLNVETWGDKNNYYINLLEKIDKIFPEARYIHLVRDGRDVATSYLGIKKVVSESPYKPVLSDNISEIAREWKNNVERIDSFLSTKDQSKVLTIKYEDLVKETVGTLRGVTSFLKVKYDEAMMNYHQQDSGKEHVALLAWKKKTLDAPDANNVNKYIDFFSQEDISQFNNIAASTLVKYEYRI